MRLIVFGLGLLIIILVCAQVCLAGGASFRGLENFPGYDISEAWGVSADGNVIVGVSNSYSGNPTKAFMWTEANGMVELCHLPNGYDSWVKGVSCDGSFIAGYDSITVFDPLPRTIQVPCRWSGPNNVQRLGQECGQAWAISADGRTVTGTYRDQVFRWTDSNGIQELGPGWAYDISADGLVIVGEGAYRWTQSGGMVSLGSLPCAIYGGAAVAASSNGSTIVGVSYGCPNGDQAFRWTEDEGMVAIGQGNIAWAVSGDGTVVVGDTNNGNEAFIWDANHGVQSVKDVLEKAYGLDLTGWHLWEALDISADGRTIVGWGGDPNGKGRAWKAVLGEPQPPSFKLTVQVEPNDVNINTVTPAVGEHIYYRSWPVILKADPFKHCPHVYRFSHWTGDVSEPNSAITTLVMTEDKTVTAVYYVDERKCGDECHPILKGDLNGDCRINFDDFAIYCQQWLSCTHPDCD